MKSIRKSYLLLIALGVIITILLLPGCFTKEKVVYSVQEYSSVYYSENDYITSAATNPIPLKPGVYRITVDTETLPEEGQFVIDLSYNHDIANYNAVKYNPVTLFGGESHKDFEIYISDTVSDLQFQIALFNADFDSINEITISTTPLQNRMLLCTTYALLIIVFIVLKLREGIIKKTISTSKQIAFAGIVTCILICFFPYLNDYITVGTETRFHLLRIESLKETLLHANQFPIRVSDYWLFGHGYIKSIFSSDLLLYFPAFLRIMGFTLTTVSKVYILVSLIMMAIISFHCINICVQNDYAATLGTSCILISPYLLHNIYNRGAMEEYTAMIFLPLIITGAFLLYTRDNTHPSYKNYKWYLVFGFTFLLQSHVITFEITGVLLIIFCTINFRKTIRKNTLLQLIQAVSFVFIINASFLIPMIHMALTEHFLFKDMPQMGVQDSGIQLVHLLQIAPYRGIGIHSSNNLQPGIALLSALVIFALYCRKTKKTGLYKYCKYGFISLVLLLIICTKYFPYQLLSLVVMIGGFYMAFFYVWLKENYTKKTCRLIATMLALFALLPALFQANYIAFVASPLRLNTAESLYSAEIRDGAYLLTSTIPENYHAHDPIAGNGILYDDYIKKGTEISMKVQNLSSQDSYIDMPLIGYHGYVVNKPLSISEERGYNNDLRINVPANYSGTLHVAYKEMTLYLIADIISLLTIWGLLVYAGSAMKKKGEDK